jgi:HemY protein
MRVFLILLVVVAGLVGLVWASQQAGSVVITTASYEIETSLVAGIVAIFVLALLAFAIWRVVFWLVGMPKRLRKARAASKLAKARTALADGLLAAEGGDTSAARKLAEKAQDIDDPRLALLLGAKAAQSHGDLDEAKRLYGQLEARPGAALAARRGLMAVALARGDIAAAAAQAKSALSTSSAADWPIKALFDMRLGAADWRGALDVLAQGEKLKLLTGDPARRRKAVLLTALTQSALRAKDGNAGRHAAEAVKLCPTFTPAPYWVGRAALEEGRGKKGLAGVEAAWKSAPHPALARLYEDLSEATDRKARADARASLIALAPTHREGRILEAERCLLERQAQAALDVLDPLIADHATSRLLALKVEALRALGHTVAAEDAARLAAAAAREADWSDLSPDARAFDYSDAEWARLVYAFGDHGQMIHPRHERYSADLAPGEKVAALPAPRKDLNGPPSPPPADYALDD